MPHYFRAVFILLICCIVFPAYAKDTRKISAGSKVGIEYSMALENGKVIRTNAGKKPFEFVQGKSQLFPAVEKALLGLKVNESKEITLTPQQAFGPINPNKIVAVSPDSVPENSRKVGAQLVNTDKSGKEQAGIVQDVKPDRIILNFNHPLAGQTIKFTAKVLSIK